MNLRKALLIAIIFVFSSIMVFPLTINAAGTVKINKKKLVLEVGESYKLKIKGTKKQAKWSSSNRKIVSVKDGRLKAKAMGEVWITAKVNGKTYKCKVISVDCEGMNREQKEVVKYALKYVGNRYRYGGSSLTNGTDCSGFTMSVYSRFGYDLEHNAGGQLHASKKVKLKNVKPGDLLFYGYGKNSCSHVAIYIGNNKIVHASTSSTGILISDYMYRNCIGAGRVLK